MGRIEKSIEIKAPPDKVWEMLAFDRFPEWTETFGERVEYTSEVHTPKDRYRVGATAQGIPEKQGDDYCRFEITESLENEKISYRAWEETFFGTLSMFTTYSLEPLGTATKVTYELESELPFGIFGKFLEKLFARRWAEKMIWKALENLKSVLER
ncbi:MAG: SRPBCC family protein [Candidatus Bathyarchaeota archaeon]|nr:SRPBCC family protein [Candidatus Bathyarchaeota archaeon]